MEAISLAAKLKVPILLDDMAGRKVAALKKIPVAGTLGILVIMKKEGFINLRVSFNKLKRTNFHYNEKLISAILKEHG